MTYCLWHWQSHRCMTNCGKIDKGKAWNIVFGIGSLVDVLQIMEKESRESITYCLWH